MVDSKTVDNLGPEAHQRYIEDIRLLSDEEVKKIFQTPKIATRAEVLKTSVQIPEIDQLLGLKESEAFAFMPPPNFVLATEIFTYQLVPSFGPIEEIIEKLESVKEKKKKRKKRAKEETEKDSEQEKQRKKLLKFATLMSSLNKILADIKKRKDEYHKG